VQSKQRMERITQPFLWRINVKLGCLETLISMHYKLRLSS